MLNYFDDCELYIAKNLDETYSIRVKNKITGYDNKAFPSTMRDYGRTKDEFIGDILKDCMIINDKYHDWAFPNKIYAEKCMSTLILLRLESKEE